jgi:hypothetical protein
MSARGCSQRGDESSTGTLQGIESTLPTPLSSSTMSKTSGSLSTACWRWMPQPSLRMQIAVRGRTPADDFNVEGSIVLKLTAKQVFAALALLVFMVPSVGQAQSQDKKISGSLAMTYSDQHPIPVGDAEGHALAVTQAKGSNHNTGKTDYMEGADVTSTELADLTQGNGPHHGWIMFSKGGDVTVNRWSGAVKTVLSPQKTPITTFHGTWTMVRGTGRYHGATGSGRYHGKITSEKGYTVEWDGDLVLKEKHASK